ncbi:MAG: hypothetical protein EZS26_000755 [Candidatus Ordinivivax streblomastigis]|uniref:VRR-NUC domain-containing protein n=1 Tax=Candidatus Ordinivivax streblomastigis TaxID=2540710 RepID=A0A5M8P494_9BACT|nr:MAG: hypothetical protein EZS26_000755 [Candidatus Ordinivivax streblomastigis]
MKHDESKLQMSCVHYCKIKKYRTIKGNYEGKIDPRSGKRENAMGYCKGSFDLMVELPNGIDVRFEFKSETGRMSDEQKDYQLFCKDSKRNYHVCRSINDFVNVLNKYIAQ